MEVARLEAVFTGDDSSFEKIADGVETRMRDLDGETAEVQVGADATEAERSFADVLAELRQLDEAQVRPRLEADVSDAETELERLRFELEAVDGERPKPEVLADVTRALDDLDKAQRALDDLDSEVVRPRIDPAGVQEFGDEANSTAREAAASFDGSAESISEVFQEVAANAFAGFGPVGAAAGIAVAAGLGTAIAAAQKLAEENTAAKESATEMALAMVDGTHDARDAFRDFATEVREDNPWTLWANESTTALQEVSDAAAEAGIDVGGLLGALAAGEMDAARHGLAGLRDEQERLRDVLAEGTTDYGEYGRAQTDAARAAEAQLRGLDDLIPKIEEQVDASDQARETAILLKQAEDDLTRAEAELALATDETNRAQMERVEGSRDVAAAEFDLADAIRDTKSVTEDAESSERDRRRAVFELSGDILDLAAAEEAASGDTRDYNRVIDQNRREFIDAARAAGYTRDEAKKLAREYGLIPKDVNTDIGADGSQARAEARRVGDELAGIRDRTVTITTIRRFAGAQAAGLADGAVVDYYAAGGFSESHVAQIAPAGAWRVWAEPETGGEAYIPLAPSKRARSMEILEETAARMGARVVAQADGSVMSAPSYAGPATATATFSDAQVRILADAMREGAAVGLAGHEAAQDRASRYARSR